MPRLIPASSSLPLQMALYLNVILACIFFLYQCSVHIHKRYTFQYDHYMEIIVPIFLGLYGICEAVRLYLGWSGNLMERIPSLSAFLLLTIFPIAPLVLYLSFFQRQSLPIEPAIGIPFIFVLVVEVIAGYTTARQLIQKQTALFYSLCQQQQPVATSKPSQ